MTMPTAPFADIEQMLTDVTVGMLANVVAIPLAGEPFAAFFTVAGVDPLEPPSFVGNYELRYAARAALLDVGDLLVIRGGHFRVAGDPAPIGAGTEFVARLREDRCVCA